MKRVPAFIVTGKPAERRSPYRLIRGLMASAIGACVLCALLTLSVSAARAEAPRLVQNGTIPSEGGLGVAVDQSSGDVFVVGFINFSPTGEELVGRGEKLDASGKALSPPTPFAEGLHYGAAVNPTNGRLYVASAFGSIEVYDPNTGELLSSFSVPAFWATPFPELLENAAQLATDAAGNVYVPNIPGNEVLKYSESGTLLETITGSGASALKGPTGVAVDSSGDVWIADDGHNRIEELSPTGVFLGEIKTQEDPRSLAVYEHEGTINVLAIVNNGADSCGLLEPPCAHLVEYSSGGAQLADLGSGDFGKRPGAEITLPQPWDMVAVDEARGRVYVADAPKSLVWVFQSPVAPAISRESAIEADTVEAKLGALIDPGGAQTTYRFEYDTREYRAGEGPHGVSVPLPEGSAGESFSAHTVWASAKGLEPGTTYHYRAVATNGVGTVVGPDRTFTTETAAQAACPNEQARGGFSAALPDCRAYELVSTANRESAQPDTGHLPAGVEGGNYAADNGNRYAYRSLEVMPGSQSAGLEFIATRGASGWTSEDAIPLQPYTGDRCTYYPPTFVLLYSADLSMAVLRDNDFKVGFPIECQAEAREVVSGEPLGVENLLLRNNETGTYQLINVAPPGITPVDASVVAASANLSVVVFDERAKLTPEAPEDHENMYEWREGVVRLLKFVLPSGAPVAGSLVGFSEDGSEMFFTAGGNLYVRLNGGRTVQVDEARGGSGPGGGGSFSAVTADGSHVFFSDEASAGLTSDTVPGSGTNLYRYDVDTGQLSDLTPVSHADAGFAGVGEDGSYLYFSSEGVLSGSQANQFGEKAESGRQNLYVDHDGTITFVWHAGTGAMSSNGAFFAFESGGNLTGDESNAAHEIYLYSAAANRVECASCSPSGEGIYGVSLPYPPNSKWHWVSDNGQVFFETGEALLPRDTNGMIDVYEFDFYSGLHLISTGTSSDESRLLPATPSGDDVFFLTRQGLVPQDNSQEANKIYDARVDGGFPEQALLPACTTADACRAASTPEPAIFGEPASQTFSGAGSLAPGEAKAAKSEAKPRSKPLKCKRRFAKRKGRCVKKPEVRAGKSARAKRGGK